MAKSELVDQSKRRFLKAGVLALTGGAVTALGFRPVVDGVTQAVKQGLDYFKVENELTDIGNLTGIWVDLKDKHRIPEVRCHRFATSWSGDRYMVDVINYFDGKGGDLRLRSALYDSNGKRDGSRWQKISHLEVPINKSGMVRGDELIKGQILPRELKYLIAKHMEDFDGGVFHNDAGETLFIPREFSYWLEPADPLLNPDRSFQQSWWFSTMWWNNGLTFQASPAFLQNGGSCQVGTEELTFFMDKPCRVKVVSVYESDGERNSRYLQVYLGEGGSPLATTEVISRGDYNENSGLARTRIAGSVGALESEWRYKDYGIGQPQFELAKVTEFFGTKVDFQLSSPNYWTIPEFLIAMSLDQGPITMADWDFFKGVVEKYKHEL